MNWVKRFRKTRGDGYRPPPRVHWLAFVLTMLFLAGLGYVVAYPYLKRPPLIERDFVGKVADKSLTVRESEMGSRPVMRLLVEDRDGKRFRVGVTGELYERARVGMWVSRRAGELKLHFDEPEPVPPGGGGARVEAR